jgi:hypothetical protein
MLTPAVTWSSALDWVAASGILTILTRFYNTHFDEKAEPAQKK